MYITSAYNLNNGFGSSKSDGIKKKKTARKSASKELRYSSVDTFLKVQPLDTDDNETDQNRGQEPDENTQRTIIDLRA